MFLNEVVTGAARHVVACLLYTSDAADERSSVDLGGRRIIKKKKKNDKRGGRRRIINHIGAAAEVRYTGIAIKRQEYYKPQCIREQGE